MDQHLHQSRVTGEDFLARSPASSRLSEAAACGLPPYTGTGEQQPRDCETYGRRDQWQAPYSQTTAEDVSADTQRDKLRRLYWRQFNVRDARSSSERELVHRLRFQVYCIENAFESPDEHRDGREFDLYDSHSVHALLMHRASGHAMGTVRIVLPLAENPGASFAIQKICAAPELKDPARFPLHSTGEISRFCIAKAHRRDSGATPRHIAPPEIAPVRIDARAGSPTMTLGLIQWLVEASRTRGLTHWCAVMEPQLLRLLARIGIHFDRIGALVRYHGWRQPCVVEIAAMLARVRAERPDIWSVIAHPASIGTDCH